MKDYCLKKSSFDFCPLLLFKGKAIGRGQGEDKEKYAQPKLN